MKAEAGQPERTFAPEAIAEQAQNALKAKVPEPAPEVKKSKKSKKAFSGGHGVKFQNLTKKRIFTTVFN